MKGRREEGRGEEAGRGLRRTFSRGMGVLMGGRESRTPEGVDEIGHVLSNWFKSAWAPSRAVAERSSSKLPCSWRGLGSFASRSPKSKV